MLKHRLFMYCAALVWLSGASAQDRLATVVAAAAREMPLYQTIPLSGTITSAKVADVSVATSGLVKGVPVEDGDRVQAGQVLLQLDAGLAQQAVNSAAAAVREAQIAQRDAERRLAEAEALLPKKSISQSMVRTLEAEVEQDQAALQRLQADAAYQRELLARHTVKAPFSGVVSQRSAEQGEWVQTGQSVLTLVSQENLRIDFSVSEEYLGAFSDKPSIRFQVSSLPNRQFESQTLTKVPVTDPSSRTFLVRVPIDKGSASLAPGLSVNASLKLPVGRSGVVVPRDALLRYPDGRMSVWTVNNDGDYPVAIENIVQAGISFDDQVEIIQGVEAEQRVIVRGNESLQQNQRIRLQQE